MVSMLLLECEFQCYWGLKVREINSSKNYLPWQIRTGFESPV